MTLYKGDWQILADIDKKHNNCGLDSISYNALKPGTNNFQEDRIEECLKESAN
jgi:hypothetical protein